MEHQLTCQTCENTFEPGGYPQGCPRCVTAGMAGRLEVVLTDPDAYGPVDDRPDMWRYRSRLPLLGDEPVTLGEGWTPLIHVDDPAEDWWPDANVYLKNETTNPTWSFKDRLNSLLISNATALGERYFATSSTGNHGASTAAYARRGGAQETIVLLPPETDKPLRTQVRAYGAHAVVTEIEGRRRLLAQLVDDGWYPTVSISREYTGLPYSYEAYKTIAFELVDQLGGVPDAVFVAIGAGDGLYGIWKGFRELAERNLIERTPRMVGVQPAERPSVVAAIDAGESSVGTADGPLPITISTSGPSAGDHALRAIEESDGDAIAIDREAIEAAVRVAGRQGVFVEPSSALTVAALEPATTMGVLEDDETAVCIATGAGVKWPSYTESIVGSVPAIDPTMDALASTIGIDLEVGSS